MKKLIIHLSDLHFRRNWDEDQGLVLNAFFNDLSKQVENSINTNIYLIFSGDVVFAGSDPQLYEKFLKQFDLELTKLRIPKSQRVCVPGNHDVSQDYVAQNHVEHEGVVAQGLKEREFNDYIQKQPSILKAKFKNYQIFEKKFANYGVSDNILLGTGWDLDDNIAIYCINSAICSSAGYNNINDKGRLAVDTRSLNRWIIENKARTKILAMHHPLEWLTDWAQVEIKKLLKSTFALCLTGHVHEQTLYHSITESSSLVECAAPPLLTDKKGKLGYALITASNEGVLNIKYRQWTKNNNFVTGVDFSNTDDGIIVVKREEQFGSYGQKAEISRTLKKRLNDSLKSFSSQPIVWVEPVISRNNGLSRNLDHSRKGQINISDFLSNPKSSIISAPPQFGLTCLGHYIAKEAWNLHSFLWLYLDSNNIKSSHRLERAINRELEALGVQEQKMNGIILDSWKSFDNESIKTLAKLCALYKNLPIIILQTVDDSKFSIESDKINIDREFENLRLLALPRGHIRKVVAAYNEEKHIGEEDRVVSKVVSDLEVLNIHRTPLNCLTLLKVSEKYFDESPVNRTKMLEMVLFLLFNMDELPTYRARPDLKDCEYVLGRFCEKMIRQNSTLFSRDDFLTDLSEFCSEKLIDLEVDVVFDVLYANQIIIKRENQYCFRFSYWIYYFAAQRMHHSPIFAEYIFKDKRYASFPEIIEFYTGIDRRREDALKILLDDVHELCNIVYEKVGLPQNMNPYRLIKWAKTEKSFQDMQREITENVLNSNLPDSVKDRYADRNYNQLKPYDQNLNVIFHKYSLVLLMQSIKAASRALRNSDYANPTIKEKLIGEIMRSWEQLSNVFVALAPLLAVRGQAHFEGANVILWGEFGETIEERLKNILISVPSNVVGQFRGDLFSHKMGPLLYKHLEVEKNDLSKHEIFMMLVQERPRHWKTKLEDYIVSLSDSDFFLSDIFLELCSQYQYSFASSGELGEMKFLIKMIIAKHELGEKKPKMDKILRIPNKNLPKRAIDDQAD